MGDIHQARTGAGGFAPASTTRRAVLRLLARASIVAPVAVLAACRSVAPAAAPGATITGGSSTRLQYPTYVAFQGPPADLPGSAEGVAPAYFSFPKNLTKSVATPPGQGGTITAYAAATATLPALDQTPAWQELNRQLNATLNFVVTTGGAAEDRAKLALLMAGNDLPDIVSVGNPTRIPNLAGAASTLFQDLTPYLSGDAIKAYPNLANLPPYAWKNIGVVFDHKIYGIPAPTPLYLILLKNQQLLDQVGSSDPKDADEWKRMMLAVTRPQAGVWGILPGWNFNGLGCGSGVGPFLQVFGVPLAWSVNGGKLIRDIETDQFKSALAFANDLYAAGVMPPDALTYTTTASDTDFVAGKFSMYDGIWTAFKDRFWPRAAAQNPLARLTATTPFSADGQANPQTYARATGPRATYLKKASDARIKEVLGVLNFLAAPFGTQEDALLTYGVKDVDYTFDDQGNPVPNPQGLSSTPMPWRNLASPPPATFSPVKSKEFAQLVHPAEQTLVAAQAPIAVDGLYSATDATRGAALAQMLADAELAIVSGRSPVSSWDQTVQDWRAQGGDQTRGELEQLLAAGV